jgi:hypothetical protein
MTEEDPMKLNVADGLKGGIEIEESPLSRRVSRKPALLDKLREALHRKVPKYTQQQLDALAAKDSGSTKKKVDDMTDFAVGAFWEPLEPNEEALDEPQNFQGARAPTVPEEDANIQPQPKHNFEWSCDRPPFKGGTEDGRTREKGRAKPEFLKKHYLDKDSLPVEFAEAFIPMFTNPVKDKMEYNHISMQDLANWTNIKAHRNFAGEATYMISPMTSLSRRSGSGWVSMC